MHRFSLFVAALAVLLTLTGCGSDEKEDDESTGCASFLNATTQCMDGWCAGDGAGNAYCDCYERGAALTSSCDCKGDWRALHRAAYCTDDMPDDAGRFLDCEGTKSALGLAAENKCG